MPTACRTPLGVLGHATRRQRQSRAAGGTDGAAGGARGGGAWAAPEGAGGRLHSSNYAGERE